MLQYEEVSITSDLKAEKYSTKIHYIAKNIGSPPSNETLDYFSNFHEYKS